MTKEAHAQAHGASLIEFILLLVIAAASIPPLLMGYVRIEEKHLQLMPINVATNLASGKMEEFIKGTSFADIVSEAQTNFGSPFAPYRYQVTVNYVNQNDLDTSVDPTVTAFKKVLVRVTHANIPDLAVEISSLVTNP
ncbi:MAG: hypothetical protein HY540_04105 [Deltaproteobacteria bacterium]|nr:hypothetical protein [Deltaproteobacteria bacterium]